VRRGNSLQIARCTVVQTAIAGRCGLDAIHTVGQALRYGGKAAEYDV
jgi:hypothetical protein